VQNDDKKYKLGTDLTHRENVEVLAFVVGLNVRNEFVKHHVHQDEREENKKHCRHWKEIFSKRIKL
jgi:hypothetical protein